MRFAHISDLHLCRDPAQVAAVRDDTFEMVQAIAKDVHDIQEILDCVIVSGDLTDDAEEDSFAQFEAMFSGLDVPIFIIPGNHDGPAAYHGHKSRSGFFERADITGRVVKVGGVRVLGLDTCVEAHTTGALGPEAIAFVRRELATPDEAPLVIVMHHPPFPTGQRVFDEISKMDGSAAFARLLRDAKVRPIILCGHVHRAYSAAFVGAACFIGGTPSAPFASALPFGDLDIRPSDEPYAYWIHQIDAAGDHVATTRPVARPPANPPAEQVKRHDD